MTYQVNNLSIDLHNYLPKFNEIIDRANHDSIVSRIWSLDHTVWREDPSEISNRLGWLTIAERIRSEIEEIEAFVGELQSHGFTNVLLLGMGGSSLAPELFSKTFPSAHRAQPLKLDILDSTDADVVGYWRDHLPLETTAFIVATKSGSTVETLSLFKFFYNLMVKIVGAEQAGNHFVGITDPDSKLVSMGKEYNFRKVFINDPNIGGRYSVLSHFGLVPAAMSGVDIRKLLESSLEVMSHCKNNQIENNPGALLGLVLGALGNNSMDKATFFTSPEISRFGDWVEQLIAESTGKNGTGILPVVHEDVGDPNIYGKDRVFIIIQTKSQPAAQETMNILQSTGQPIISIKLGDLYDLGGQFFQWEYAIAMAGYTLDINPFDQPNVESAKVRAKNMVAEFEQKGKLPPIQTASLVKSTIDEFLSAPQPGDYVAVHAYIPYNQTGYELLQRFRLYIRNQTGVATTLGYGPRFLHSTGQLHKGDGGNGHFIQFVSESSRELPIPIEPGSSESVIDFDTLKHAQALGDSQALQDAGRPVLHFSLGTDWLHKIEVLLQEYKGR